MNRQITVGPQTAEGRENVQWGSYSGMVWRLRSMDVWDSREQDREMVPIGARKGSPEFPVNKDTLVMFQVLEQ